MNENDIGYRQQTDDDVTDAVFTSGARALKVSYPTYQTVTKSRTRVKRKRGKIIRVTTTITIIHPDGGPTLPACTLPPAARHTASNRCGGTPLPPLNPRRLYPKRWRSQHPSSIVTISIRHSAAPRRCSQLLHPQTTRFARRGSSKAKGRTPQQPLAAPWRREESRDFPALPVSGTR